MKSKETISELIGINKVILDNGLDKIKPMTNEITEAYSQRVKPLLVDFKSKYGTTERNFIKTLLEDTDYKKNSNLKVQTFGHWGRKINPYIWASIFIENEKNSASDSMQFYLLINSEGLKFGFDYGDRITNNHSSVKNIQSDKNSQQIILNAINENDLEVISLEAGSPNIEFSFDRSKNIIKKEADFKNWCKDIHLTKSYKKDNIPLDIGAKIQEVINSLLPLSQNQNFTKIKEDVGYWLYAPGKNAKDWDNQFENGFMSINYNFPDNLDEFDRKEDLLELDNEEGSRKNIIKALWDFGKEINKGDIIISKQGRSKYLGYGIVTSNYIYDKVSADYKHKRKVKWIKKGEWEVEGNLPVKTLTNITEFYEYIDRLKLKLGIESLNKQSTDFSLETILKDVFISEVQFQNIVDILSTKKNIILQGSAGVGKTFIAKKIAQALQEDYSEERIEMIQFHQSYSYEDFIQGYRPSSESFELRNGVFYDICNRAKNDITKPYFLIIDEINRGNLSKIFGELMMLIEADKRGEKNKIRLTYSPSNESFFVPDNLYVIGTMNTADRSLTIVDYALRRRFAFIKMKPNYGEYFFNFLLKKGLSNEMISDIKNKMNNLNAKIAIDDSLGEGFEIGHSYFCSFKSGDHKKWLNNVFKYEIIPLIEEYWFDDQDLVNLYSNPFKS